MSGRCRSARCRKPVPARPQAGRGAGGDVVHAQRGPLAPRQARPFPLDPAPFAGDLVDLERALRRVDPSEVPVADRHRPPRHDHALPRAARDLLLVLLPLAVAVEDARDRCVAPVDDRIPGEEARGPADQDVLDAAPLAQTQMGEVWGRAVDRRRAVGAAELRQQRRLPVERLQQRRPVLLLGAPVANGVAQVLQLAHERHLRRRSLRRRSVEPRMDLP